MSAQLLLLLATSLSLAVRPPQAATGDTDHGVVYFYFAAYSLPKGYNIGTPSISVYCDGRILAKVRKGTFVGVRLPPGRHTFASKGLRTRLDETAINLDVRPGGTTFLRLEVGIGNIKWWAHLRVVGPEEGRLMVSKLEPLDPGHIEDRARAFASRPTDAGASSSEAPLTNADILTLTRAGLEDDIVRLKVQRSPAAYDMSAAGLDALRQQGVSDGVIAAMGDASRRPAAAREP
jgi:hypothetical protein